MKNGKISLNIWLAVLLLGIFVISFLYCSTVYYRNDRVVEIDNNDWSNGSSILRCEFDFDDADDKVYVNGWCIMPGVSTEYANYYVVFHNMDMDSYFRVNTGYRKREDVTTAFNDGCDYANSGFYTQVRKRRLLSGEYEVCIWWLSNNYNLLYETGKYFTIN